MLKRFYSHNAESHSALLLRNIPFTGAVLVILVFVISVWSLYQEWNDAVNQMEETVINLSLSQQRQAEDTFFQTELAMRDVKRDVLAQWGAVAKIEGLDQAMSEIMQRLPQLQGLYYYNAQGELVATSATTPLIDLNNSDFKGIKIDVYNVNDKINISSVIKMKTTGELVIPVTLRIFDRNGIYLGFILAVVDVDYFIRFYGYYKMGGVDLLVLMLPDSSIMYVRPFSNEHIGRGLFCSHFPIEIMKNMNRQNGQWVTSLDGKQRILGFARSNRYPFIVAAGYDTHSLFIKWLKGRGQYIMMILLLFSVIILKVFFLLRQARSSLNYQKELAGLKDELKEANSSLTRLAHVDALTGLANRREFDRYLADSVSKAVTCNEAVSLIMIDVDFFKRYNDTYGHIAGDECLQRVGEVIERHTLRSIDLVARYGGEEFAIILPGADASYTYHAATVAAQAVRDLDIVHKSSLIEIQCITLSIGCATLTPDNTDGMAQLLIRMSDRALYYAKKAGRNRIVTHSTGDQS